VAALAFGLALARGAAADAPPGGATNAMAELLTVARAAREDGLYAVAQKHLEAGLKLAAAGACDTPQAEQAVVLMIQVLHEQRKHREILDFLYANRRWIRKETDDGLVPFWHAVARYEVGEADEALAEVSDFERRHPASAYAGRVQRLRAWCFLKSNRLDAALKAFAAFDAATTDPAVAAENRLEWARALQAAGRLPQAREVLTRVVATATNPPAVCEAQYTLGGVLIEEGRSREALPLLAGVATNAAARDDLRAEAWFAQAAAQQAVSNTEEAVAAFTAGIARVIDAPQLADVGREPNAAGDRDDHRLHHDPQQADPLGRALEQRFAHVRGQDPRQPPQQLPDHDQRDDVGGPALALDDPVLGAVHHLAHAFAQPPQATAGQFRGCAGEQVQPGGHVNARVFRRGPGPRSRWGSRLPASWRAWGRCR